MEDIKQVLLFILMAILFLGGMPLLLGEMEDFTLLTFLTAKIIGLASVSIGYAIYRFNFRQVED